MAQPLVVKLGEINIPLGLSKVERSDLYGYIEIETLDTHGRRCTSATLTDDGKTLIGSGGVTLASLSPDGEWLDKKALIPTDSQGQRLVPVPSSYAAPVPLDKRATIEEYLSHNIRAIYEIDSEAADLSPLLAELEAGVIFQFPYSFRGSLEPDAGFLLLGADGTPFLAIGSPTLLEFVGLDQAAPTVTDEDAAEEEDESLDFSMM